MPHPTILFLQLRWPNLQLVQVPTGRKGLEAIRTGRYDIVMLHHEAGTAGSPELISQIRRSSDAPLVVIGRDDVMAKVRALELGADDWLSGSEEPMEVVAKVNAILRRCRSRRAGGEVYDFGGGLAINFATREVWLSGRPVKLTPVEFRILAQLARRAGSVVTRASLLDSLWSQSYRRDPESLRKYIHRLRCKIEEDPSEPRIIRTQRGEGYILARPS